MAQIAKGLVFVELYAVYEYTVKGVTRVAIAEIAGHAHRFAELKPSLLALFLDAELRALRDCGAKNIWEKRLKLFEQSTSSRRVAAVDTLPVDGSHFRHTQAQLILRALGIRRSLTRRRRHLYKIDEIVNNRNAIAHGEETAAQIGRRYSRADVTRSISQIKSICLRVIAIASEHCNDPQRHLR